MTPGGQPEWAMLVFAFDRPPALGAAARRDLLGAKGAGLAEMTALGLAVPPGFTITTPAARSVAAGTWPGGLGEEIAAHLAGLEERCGRRLGDPDDPLLVSVRSGAAVSMPGMMATVVDLGCTDRSVVGLAARTGDERFARDCYRRFIVGFARAVLGSGVGDDIGADLGPATDAATGDADASAAACRRAFEVVEDRTGQPFPQDPGEQLRRTIIAIAASWWSPRAVAYRRRVGIGDEPGTAVTVQAMVFGNRDDRSGTGVAWSRDPTTGEHRPYGDFVVRAQGDDLVGGTRHGDGLDDLAGRMPAVHAELLDVLVRLEAHHRDLCEVEFTVESGRLWVLQSRVATRSAAAAVRLAVDMAIDPGDRAGWTISRAEALLRVTADHLDQLGRHAHTAAGDAGRVIATGVAASPGTAVGRVRFTADAALAAVERGEAVILVRPETSPADVAAMGVSAGVLTAAGGRASHAAVIARGWGIPAVVGAAIAMADDHFRAGDVTVAAGDEVAIDGSTGTVILGARVELGPAGEPPALATLLAWADDAVAHNDIAHNDITGDDITGDDITGDDIAHNDITGDGAVAPPAAAAAARLAAAHRILSPPH